MSHCCDHVSSKKSKNQALRWVVRECVARACDGQITKPGEAMSKSLSNPAGGCGLDRANPDRGAQCCGQDAAWF